MELPATRNVLAQGAVLGEVTTHPVAGRAGGRAGGHRSRSLVGPHAAGASAGADAGAVAAGAMPYVS